MDDYPKSMMEREQRFSSPDECRNYLFSMRWPNGYVCSRCGGSAVLKGVDAVVLAVRHEAYLMLVSDAVIKMTGRPVAIIDCFGILDDVAIRRYFELGCEVKGLGRGHTKRIKDQIKVKSLTPNQPGKE